ncbi:hypothetical protein SCB49_02249 [unidentified eubacterium SCB49]|nr:hypothetical protein SCB49_02249 [unidentified eubacterium SCB49]
MEFLHYLLKSAGILALFYFVYILVLEKDTYFSAKRFYLLTGLIAALLLPLITFTNTTIIERTSVAPINNITQFITNNTTETSEIIVQENALNWIAILITIYLLGVCVLLIRFTFQLFSLIHLLRNHKSKQVEQYKFIETNKEIAPFSFFKYIVYNPNTHNSDELKMILLHEKIHASQWHSIDLLAANLMRIFQWLNPVTWLYKKSMEANLEFLADTQTVEKIDNKKHYQLTLVKASSALPVPALTNNFYQSFIKKRIIMLNKKNSNKYQQLKLIIILPLLALFMWSFNTKEIIHYKDSKLNETILTSSLNKETLDISEEKKPSPEQKTEIKLLDTATKTSQQKNNASQTLIKTSTSIEKIVANFRYLINSNTTDEELESIKKELSEKHNTEFNYTTKRNTNNEITSITIQYTDDKNNSGNYAVSSDTPISDFYFFQRGNHTGFGNAADQGELRNRTRRPSKKRIEVSKERRDSLSHRAEMRRSKAKEQRAMISERRKEMRQHINSSRTRKDTTTSSSDSLFSSLRGKPIVYLNGVLYKGDLNTINPDQIASVNVLKNNSAIKKYGVRARNGVIEINLKNENSTSTDAHFDNIIISKNTTDNELQNILKTASNNGKIFTYKRVKRNSKGEITSIKITVNDNKGNKQTISKQTNTNEPIEDIQIAF